MNVYLAQGLGLLVLLAAVRGARIRQIQGGQCEVGLVIDEVYSDCLRNRSGFKSMLGMVRTFQQKVPGTFNANDAIYALKDFCGEMLDIGTCLLNGIPSCEDRLQKLEVVAEFAAKSSICDAIPWIDPFFKKHGDELTNPVCVFTFVGMIKSCYKGMGDVFDDMDGSTQMSELMALLNTVSDTIGGCLFNPNYALLPPGCDSTSAQTFATFEAMVMNILGPPGLALTAAQLQEIQDMA